MSLPEEAIRAAVDAYAGEGSLPSETTFNKIRMALAAALPFICDDIAKWIENYGTDGCAAYGARLVRRYYDTTIEQVPQ